MFVKKIKWWNQFFKLFKLLKIRFTVSESPGKKHSIAQSSSVRTGVTISFSEEETEKPIVTINIAVLDVKRFKLSETDANENEILENFVKF